MNVFRIPFDWYRLQPPALNGEFEPAEINALDALVQHATVTKGVYVVLDAHKYVLRKNQDCHF
jgi:aryl-phospho-beta-D-glucosidase BglC (GH1 family)